MIDINKPVSNPELVHAIEAFLAEQTQQNEQVMVALLKTAYFLMVFDGNLIHDTPDAEGRITIQAKSTLELPMFSNSEGKSLHFAFTDWAALGEWNNAPNQNTLVVQLDDIASMVLSEKLDCAGAVINPCGQDLFLDRQRLAYLTGRANPQVIKEDTQVMIGEPANYPSALVDAVIKTAKPLREVKKIWLALMVKEGEQSYLLVVDHKGDRSQVNNAIAQATMPHLDRMFLDIVDADSDFGKSAIGSRKPFFKRGLFG